ncbi:DUF4360 domain-containing protein [Microbulbifer sp. GL-2]|uniref:DUF4360 domain-containing protein n=1 Tax=Microbulbifer sp. GL-2 TaxID=2591606 RepID=UPI0011635C96|nr:DUF4360 domain-containing protein [Microbulbifer sp. GL-2]BBM04061.1 hypothetical protein GL2_41350 [Microbulbifer sp. GL-2]
MFNKLVTFAFCAIFSGPLLAKSIMIDGQQIEIGEIAVNGTGCPVGSVAATATDDNKNIAILFSSYSAITNSANPVANSDCNLAIPLSVEPGFSVGILDIDWRGTVYSAPGSLINFHREYFFSGNQGPSHDNNWNSSEFENFLLNDRPPFVYYSGCDGEALIARADTAATVIGADSLFSLRAADVGAELLLNVQIIPCDE